MDDRRVRYWAQLAEIISGVAVVVTLVFLIFEVRENSEMIRANTFDRNIESLIDVRMHIASNENSLRVMTDHWGIESPDDLRRQLYVVSIWSIYEKTYYSQRYGLVGTAEWERFETRICNYVRSRFDFWRENVATFLTEEFRGYVITNCGPVENRNPETTPEG